MPSPNSQRGFRGSRDEAQQVDERNRYGSVRPVQTGVRGKHAGGVKGGRPQSGHAKPAGKKKGSTALNIAIALAALVFVCSVGTLAFMGYSYWKGADEYDQIERMALSADSGNQLESMASSELGSVSVDWDALWAINPDVVAWIYVPGTIINYPVLHSETDGWYVDHDFYGKQGWRWMPNYGAIFLETVNQADFSDRNNIIAGHDLANGEMFAPLAKFSEQSEFDSHRVVYLFTPQGNYRLTTFALDRVPETEEVRQVSFVDENDFSTYLQDKLDRAVVSAPADEIAAMDMSKIFMFYTCDASNNHYRFLLFCSVDEYASAQGSGSVAQGAEATDSDMANAIDEATKELT